MKHSSEAIVTKFLHAPQTGMDLLPLLPKYWGLQGVCCHTWTLGPFGKSQKYNFNGRDTRRGSSIVQSSENSPDHILCMSWGSQAALRIGLLSCYY